MAHQRILSVGLKVTAKEYSFLFSRLLFLIPVITEHQGLSKMSKTLSQLWDQLNDICQEGTTQQKIIVQKLKKCW